MAAEKPRYAGAITWPPNIHERLPNERERWVFYVLRAGRFPRGEQTVGIPAFYRELTHYNYSMTFLSHDGNWSTSTTGTSLPEAAENMRIRLAGGITSEKSFTRTKPRGRTPTIGLTEELTNYFKLDR